MSSSSYSELRQIPRYGVSNDAVITATIGKIGDSFGSLTGKVLDISMMGAKFETPTALPLKERLTITIDGPGQSDDIELTALVRWTNPARGGLWHSGFAFEHPIRPEVLQSFVDVGLLDRRLQQRDPISLSASARWEFDPEDTPVLITDHSPQGGFCLVAPSAGDPGSRVQLLFEKDGREISIRGKIRWQTASEGVFLVGCEFLRGEDAASFAMIVSDEPTMDATEQSPDHWFQSLRQNRSPGMITPVRKPPPIRRPLLISAAVCGAALLMGFVYFKRSSTPQVSPPVVAKQQAPMPSSLNSKHTSTNASPRPSTPHQDEDAKESPAAPRSPASPIEQSTIADEGMDIEHTSTVPDETPTPTIAQQEPPDDATPLDRPLAEEHPFDDGPPIEPNSFVDLSELQPVDDKAKQALRAPSAKDRQDALDHYLQGRSRYFKRQYQLAVTALESAVQSDSSDPRFYYILALTQYQLRDIVQAERSVVEAVELEEASPIEEYGRMMERYQGPARIWLEKTRRRAQHSQAESSQTEASPQI